jgi:hypothetical protein
LHQTKGEADMAAKLLGPKAFVLPPVSAWGGKGDPEPDPAG